jgi:hypothetical protein
MTKRLLLMLTVFALLLGGLTATGCATAPPRAEPADSPQSDEVDEEDGDDEEDGVG